MNFGDFNIALAPFGKPIGPIRIWKKGADMPGLMMSRTFGDGMAHKHCGVIENPELNKTEMKPNFSGVVVASDGVYDKLGNVEVGKILGRYAESKDAKKAASEIVKFSKNAWLNVKFSTSVF